MSDTTPLANQLRWYIALRVLVVVSVLGLYGLAQLAGPSETVGPPEAPTILSHQFLVRIGGLTCLLTLLHIGLFQWLKGTRREPLLAYLQFGGDLLLITLLIHNSGDIASPFSMLYLIVIALASTLLRRRAGVTVATAAYLCYLILVLLAYRHSLGGSWRLSGLGDFGEAVLRDGRLLYNLTTHLLGFYTVALLTSYLAGDVTRAQRELEAKSEVLADLQVVHRDVIESISSGLITTDLDGLIVGVNRAGALILYREAARLVGTRIQDLPLFSPQRWAELTAESEQRGRLRSEVEIDTGRGRAFVGFSISQLTDSSGTHRGYIVIFQDLSSWQRLQEQVRMKDRMAAVGELAAGLAHEIGNPLAAISGSVQMLAQSGQQNDPGESKLIEILLRESQRLDRTIKGFLRFARPREGTNLRFDIARLLSENFELLRNSQEVSASHRLALDLDPPAAAMVADPDQVSQIFWNLARNSLRAMPEGGELRVVGRLSDGRYRLQVIDTGHGMTEEQQANLFHPFRTFFETGTGIGMAIVYRIVQSHQGTISVESRLGQGTVITVELPIVETAVETLEQVLR